MSALATLRLPGPAGVAALGLTLAGAVCAALAPALYWSLLEAAAVLGLAVLAWRHTEVTSAAWLALTACTLEMTLLDLAGPGAYQATVAATKAMGLALALFCVLRYGPRLDLFNPAWGFLLIFAVGLAHGLHPGLTPANSLRSLLGSAAPYAFAFSRLSRRWAAAVIRAAQWAPMLSVAGGICLALAGLRPLFVESGGLRLEALGHPAFLADAALTAVYASLVGSYRNPGGRDLALLMANGAILLLTGARAAALRRRGRRADPRLRHGASDAATAARVAAARRRHRRAGPAGGRRDAVGSARVQLAARRRRGSQRARRALALFRAGGGGLALARLGPGRGQRRGAAGQ